MKGLPSHRSQKGQTLLISVIAMLIVVMAIFILFDVHTVIRGKVKLQNAVDAAALVGANWQMNTLNLVGELNMVKACTALITDDIFGISQDPGDYLSVAEKKDEASAVAERDDKLKLASDTLSQMQQRILFLGPLIGFGAAQQAAKNNGANYNKNYGEALKYQLQMLAGDGERASLYAPYTKEEYVKENLFSYSWRDPYLNLLNTILENDGELCKGIAVMCNGQILGAPYIYTEGSPAVDFASHLSSRRLYSAAASNYYCWLIDFLKMDFAANGSKWWGELRLGTRNNFRKECEFLPVNVEIRNADASAYKQLNDLFLDPLLKNEPDYGEKLGDYFDVEMPVYDQNNKVVTDPGHDNRIRILPALSWAYYGSKWSAYSDLFSNMWKSFLRAPLRSKARYYSGAVARMDAYMRPKTITGNRGIGQRASDEYLGEVLSANSGSSSLQRAGSRISNAEQLLRQSPYSIYSTAVAKPFGWLSVNGKEEPPHLSGVVLPVFKQSALIPAAMENPGLNPLADFHWYQFLLRYLPVLGEVSAVSQIPAELQSEFSYEHQIIKEKLDDEKWRQNGLAWLLQETNIVKGRDPETNETIYYTNEESCFLRPSGGGGGDGDGGGSVSGGGGASWPSPLF